MNTYAVLRIVSYIMLFSALIIAPFCIPASLAIGMPKCNNTSSLLEREKIPINDKSQIKPEGEGRIEIVSKMLPPYDYKKGCVNLSSRTLEILLISFVVATFSFLLTAVIIRILMKYCCVQEEFETIIISTSSPDYFNPNDVTYHY